MCRYCLLGLLLITPLVFYPFLRDSRTHIDVCPAPRNDNPLSEQAQIALHCFSAMPGPMMPASVPWDPLCRIALDKSKEMDKLVETDPVKFLELCLAQYPKNVQGYRCIFDKHEKVNGTMRDPEIIRAHFREKPFSVHMAWLDGADRA